MFVGIVSLLEETIPMEILLPKVAMTISLLRQPKINKHGLYDEACKRIPQF
jgi:hypothetical protein